jgi:hypothetical protein
MPLNRVWNKGGFSHGLFVYASEVLLAPQETRTYFVTAVTAQRRRNVSTSLRQVASEFSVDFPLSR